MAISWWSALKILPWSDMIEYAPKVVSGAQKAWQRVKSGKEAPESAAALPLPAGDPLATLQQDIRSLQAQQVELSNLLTQLADQNQRLVDAVDVLRLRTRLLWWGLLVNGAALLALVFWYFPR